MVNGMTKKEHGGGFNNHVKEAVLRLGDVSFSYLACEGGVGAFPCSGEGDLTSDGDLIYTGDVAAKTQSKSVHLEQQTNHDVRQRQVFLRNCSLRVSKKTRAGSRGGGG